MEKLLKMDLHNLWTKSNIRMMKSRRVRWVWHVACMRDTGKAYRVFIVRYADGKGIFSGPRRR